MSQIREFMSRVVPWPRAGEPGYIDLIYTITAKTGDKVFWSGKPTRTLDGFMEQTAWAAKQPFVKDIYYCLSLQSAMRTDKNGKEKPIRLQANAIALKAIWLDVDVKDPPKGYTSIMEALDAVGQFVHSANLPMPTAIVSSGGGLHVYFLSNRSLTLDEWRPYAEGLKNAALKFGLRCDAGCTIDSARVLRLSGTFNCKIAPPRPVKLLGLQETDYDFSIALSTLPPMAAHSERKSGTGAVAPGYESWADKGTPAAFAGLKAESLAEGLQKEDRPLDPKPIMKGCAFLRNALLTGGKDYDQPMWNLTTLAATFLEEGHSLAHKMGRGHAEYDVATSEALWERKLKERKDRLLGWPSCKAIQASGCTACATCPHFKEGKSPLHLALAPPSKPVISQVAGQPVSTLMPEGFGVDKDGNICKVKLEEQEEGPPLPIYTKIFTCRISSPWASSGPHELHFTASVDKGHVSQIDIELEVIQAGGPDLLRTLGRAGVKCYPPGVRYLTEFLMAWLTKLHDAQESVISVPFGWWMDKPDPLKDAARHGFVYGGLIMKDDGSDGPSGMGDKNLRAIYQPVGNIDPWGKACRMVNAQKRPELDAIIAAAFASPLMVTTGEYSALLSVWGPTGVCKSTALKVGLAVWGHPKKGKETTNSTSKSVIHKMGQIRNLPVFWDEIRNKEVQKHVYNTFFNGSEGVGGGRLTSNIEQRDKDDWQNLLVTCSNISMVDYVVSDQRTTTAGMYRVFEYNILKLDNAPGQINTIDASRMTQELEHNYGQVGLKYARLLANSPDASDELTKGICNRFAASVQATKEERYWVAVCGTLLAGAGYANLFGAQINTDALTEFLKVAYQANRARMVDEATEGGSRINTDEALTGFLQANIENALFTGTFPMGRGKPKQVSFIFGPDQNRPRPIHVQWAVDDRLLRFSRRVFAAYLRDTNTSPVQITNSLKELYKAETIIAILGAGTSYRTGLQEHVIQIPVPVGSILESAMLAHTPHEVEDLQPAGVVA